MKLGEISINGQIIEIEKKGEQQMQKERMMVYANSFNKIKGSKRLNGKHHHNDSTDITKLEELANEGL